MEYNKKYDVNRNKIPKNLKNLINVNTKTIQKE
jgi:hypothetical protein